MFRIRSLKLVAVGLWCVAASVSLAWGQAPQTGLIDRVYKDEAGEHKYVVFLPANYTPEKKWPVILFLHGAGECGSDGRQQTTVGLGPFVRQQAATFPFIVVFPQCEDTRGRILLRWRPDQPDGRRALKILDTVEKDYSVDMNRQVLAGWSMGGYGAWAQGAADPKRWSAVVPMAGGGDPKEVVSLKDTPVWAFHGANDGAVKVEESRRMVEALKAAGGHPLYTEVPEGDHDVWKTAFAMPDLTKWMLNPGATEVSTDALAVKPGMKLDLPPSTAPFIPAVYIPRAISLRLGNDALGVLSDSVPKYVTHEMLNGSIGDIYDSTVASGRTFGIQFSGIYYNAQLYRAAIKAYAPDRLNVQLGLSNLQMTISSTYVSGSGKSAVAGPISVVAGHAYPVWLSFDVKPYIDDQRRIRLQLLDSRFSIPADNYYVTNPAGVSTRGLGMTESRVTDGLVSGLYGARYRIENEVRGVVPSIVTQLEERLSFNEIDQVASGVWPLPVYQPRVKIWPDEVSTDENGVTLVLGMTAAAVNPQVAPKTPRTVDPQGPAAKDVAQTTSLQVGLAPGILTEVSRTIVDADMARIHVLDTPVKSLKTFVDPQVVAEMIPEIRRYGSDVEIWAELVLTKPVAITGDSSGKGAKGAENSELQFKIPGMLISLAIKPDKSAKDWQPFAEVKYDIAQTAVPRVVDPTLTTRAVEFAWEGSPDVTTSARFAPDYKPEDDTLNEEKFHEIFLTVWKEWLSNNPATQVVIPDVDFGYTKMRLQDVAWRSPDLVATLGKPQVVLRNLTEKALVYETKGPYSNWGQPITLKPGDTNRFDIAFPLLFRYTNTEGRLQYYTLPAGSVSEYRVPKEGRLPGVFQAREEMAQPPAPESAADARP